MFVFEGKCVVRVFGSLLYFGCVVQDVWAHLGDHQANWPFRERRDWWDNVKLGNMAYVIMHDPDLRTRAPR